nr:response regulator [Dyadobacter psychrotolerans]
MFEGGEQLYHYLIQQSSPNFMGLLPGLIILNFRMPVLNGYELLKLLRQTPDNAHTQWRTLPIVMMTSENVSEEVKQCYQAGANSFVTKPIIFEELRELMETICHYWLDSNLVAAASSELH